MDKSSSGRVLALGSWGMASREDSSCVCVCACLRLCACFSVCMSTWARLILCRSMCMVCMRIHVHVCACVSGYAYVHGVHFPCLNLCVYGCVCVCVCVYVYVCVQDGGEFTPSMQCTDVFVSVCVYMCVCVLVLVPSVTCCVCLRTSA